MKSHTADLFAETDASPASAPAPPSPALRPLKAGGVPPTTQTAGHTRPKQLWYAAVFPELVNMEHSAAVLRHLCLHAQRFTSFVSIELPNALLLEIKGSLKLFGPLERLHADIDDCWRRLALPAHSATAPSTLAALWLARGRHRDAGHPVVIEDLGTLSGHLAKLPIACTAWDIERLQTLRAMGVTCMGELLRLPRAGLARRLGPTAVQDLDIALARQFAPRRAFVPRERFRARCDFETEIETVAYLEKALEPLIARCAQFLRERQAGVQALRLKLRHRAGPATRVHLGLASITSERCRLRDVLVQKLGRLELEAPVRGVELVSGSLQPLSAGSLDVFGGSTGTGGRDTAPQLVERLRARLGEDAVYGICSIPEHRPEAAWRRIHELRLTAVSKIGGRMTDEEAIDHGMPRPVWLLNEPLPLDEPLSLPEPLPLSKPAMRRQEAGADARRAPAGRGPGWPESMRRQEAGADARRAPAGRGPGWPESMPQWHRSSVVLEQGPERIESGWWDGKGVARDYYVARQCGGRKPEPTPAGRPQGEGQDGPSQCRGRKPKPTPAGRPQGEGQDGPSQSYGARLWVFQERQSKRWYLHGVFA